MKVLLMLTFVGSLLVASPAAAAEPVANITPPTVVGSARYGETLTATSGTWTPAEVATAYQWLRDGGIVSRATEPTYRLRLGDIGHRLSVTVTATSDDQSASATSAPTAVVGRAVFVNLRRPTMTGVRRFERTLVATPGRFSPEPTRVRYQWLRDGKPIKDATRRRYRLGVRDVGARVAVRVSAKRDGYRDGVARSWGARIKHRVDVRHTVTYSVTTRGGIGADLALFKRLAQQTYDDPRGWRGTGVAFRRVASGGSFRLVLSQASLLPSFGYPCSSMWSCRVGNNVIINQDRWQHASPMWNAIGRSLRDYRHMVVNHETGHWLGHGHRYCGGPGKLAPVMMQQSKGLNGCRANPWPLPGERFTPRF